MLVHIAFPLWPNDFDPYHEGWECVVLQEYVDWDRPATQQVRWEYLNNVRGKVLNPGSRRVAMLRYAFDEWDVPRVLKLVENDTWSTATRNMDRVRLFPCELR